MIITRSQFCRISQAHRRQDWTYNSWWNCENTPILVFGSGKGKISWFILLELVFETFMLYEIFKRLMFDDSCSMICPDLEDVVCFVQDFLLLYPHRRVDLMDLALGYLVYFCLLTKTEFSCWTFVSCLENVFLWRVYVIVYWCALVSYYGMLMLLMCHNVCWISNWLGDKKFVLGLFA